MELEIIKTENDLYFKKGQAGGAVANIIVLIVGVAVATLVLIFTSALGGQTYNLVEADLDAITNGTIRDHAKNSVVSAFSAQEQTADYLPIIVLAVVIFLVLSLVLGFANFGSGFGGRGSAL